MKYVDFDTAGADKFFDALEAAAQGGFRKELELFLEGLGNEFLRIVEDEIIRRKVLDTRLLLASFHKGDGNNLWELTEGNLTLEVGSTLEYAGYVNDRQAVCPRLLAGRPLYIRPDGGGRYGVKAAFCRRKTLL